MSTLLAKAEASKIPVRAMGGTEAVSLEPGLSATEFQARLDAMRVWCKSVERLVVERRPADLRIHAGFERMSRIKPVLRRYRALALIAQSLDVYGIPDFDPYVNGMRVVPLDVGPLVNEWFIVVKAKGFGAVVAAEDLDGFGGGVKLADRRFRGIVSHHPVLVAAAMEAMDEFAVAMSGPTLRRAGS